MNNNPKAQNEPPSLLSSCVRALGPRFELLLTQADGDRTLCTLCSRFEQRCLQTQPTAHTQRGIRRPPSRRHPALVEMADRTRGRQTHPRRIQQQLAAVAEQHVRVKPATTAAHGRRWSAATSHDRRRPHRLCLLRCSSSKQPCLLPATLMIPAVPSKYRCVTVY